MKQTTLNKFIDKSSSESDDDDEEYLEVASKVKKSDIWYWTRLQTRSQMAVNKLAVYNVGEDIDTLRRNKKYKKECVPEAMHYLFDIDDYPVNQAGLTTENYALTVDQLREYASLAAKLRNKFVDRARELLQNGLNEEQKDD